TEGIGCVKTPLAPRLDRDRLVDVAARVTDPLECRFQIIHGHVEPPIALGLLGVVEIAVGRGIVAGQFKPAQRVMPPSTRYAPTRSPDRMVVEAESWFDVRDADQISGHADGSPPWGDKQIPLPGMARIIGPPRRECKSLNSQTFHTQPSAKMP